MTGSAVMDYDFSSTYDRNQELQRRSLEKSQELERRSWQTPAEDIIGDHQRDETKSKKSASKLKDDDVKDTPEMFRNVCIIYDDSEEEIDDPTWRKMTSSYLMQCKLGEHSAACGGTDDNTEDDTEHTSVDCMMTSDDEDIEDEEMHEVYVPYTKDISNRGSQEDVHDCTGEANLTLISELEQSSFLNNTWNASSASDATMPLELGSLSYTKQTPPPKLSFRKRRSVSTPKNSPVPTVRASVTPPQVDKPPVKKQRVSPTSTHLADREGPLGLVPLDTSTTGQYTVPKRPIEAVPEESFIEDSTVTGADASPSQYYSAAESVTSEFHTPEGTSTPNTSDDTMMAHTVTSPDSRNTAGRKRVSFSPQDLYIAPSGKKLSLPNLWNHSPLKYLRRKSQGTPTTRDKSKPLEAEHITDSVKLARQRRVSAGPYVPVEVKHKAVQVSILPVLIPHQDVATETDPTWWTKPISPPRDVQPQPVKSRADTLPLYVPREGKGVDSRVDKQELKIDLSELSGDHKAKVKRRTSLAATLASAFTPKRVKASRKSEFYTSSDLKRAQDRLESLPILLPQTSENRANRNIDKTGENTPASNPQISSPQTSESKAYIEEIVKNIDKEVQVQEENANPLNLRDNESNNAFVLDPVLVPMQENSDSIFADKSATLPLSANTSQTYFMPVKFDSSADDVSYFEFMQKHGRISPAIQNIVKKYRIRTNSSLAESSDTKPAQSGDDSRPDDVKKQEPADVKVEEPVEVKQELTDEGKNQEPIWVKMQEPVEVNNQEFGEEENQKQVGVIHQEQADERKTQEIKNEVSVDVKDAESVDAKKLPISQVTEASSPAVEENVSKESALGEKHLMKNEPESVPGDMSGTEKEEKEEAQENTQNEPAEPNLKEIYKNLSDVKDFIRRSFTLEPKTNLKREMDLNVENISDASMSTLERSANQPKLTEVTPSAFFDVERRPGSGTPPGARRRRKKYVTPPMVGKAQRVPIRVEETVQEDDGQKPGAVATYPREVVEDIADVAPQRKSAAKKRMSFTRGLFHKAEPKDTVDVAVQRKSSTKKKIGHNRSLFHKFKRKKGKKEKDAEEDEKKTEAVAAVEVARISEKPPKVSLFRRFSLKVRRKKPDNPGVTFVDVAELNLPDNSSHEFSAHKQLFGTDTHMPSAEEREEISTQSTQSSDVIEKTLDKSATEADSMKVLIDQADQLAMEGELTGNEEDWQVLSSMMKPSSNVKSPVTKEEGSIKDEYIDDELNDTMELTGDLYKPSEEVVSPTNVHIEVAQEPNYTSTPTKRTGALSPSLEVLFSDAVGGTNQYSSGDYVTKSPVGSSYSSEEVSDLVTDTPEKRMYYNLTNQELSPSIGGTGDADRRSNKDSAPVTPQQQVVQ